MLVKFTMNDGKTSYINPMAECGHHHGVFLYYATDGDGNDISVWRCEECGAKYVEGV